MVATIESTIPRVVYASVIEAVVYGLADAGTQIVTGYPGFHTQEIVQASGGAISINERTAYSVAWGAAFAGARSAVVLKNVGLNDAADPFVNSINLRTNAGMAVIVLDDIEVAGSQCRQDSRHYFDLAPGLWLEPISAAHAYDCARNALGWSEDLGVPVVIRLTNETLRSTGKFSRHKTPQPDVRFQRNPQASVAHPMNVNYQRVANQRRAVEIGRFVETQFSSDHGSGCVAVGAAMPNDARDHFRVWTYPLPGEGLRYVLRQRDDIDVFESGSNFATEKIRGMFTTARVNTRDHSLMVDHSANFRSTLRFESLFAAIRTVNDRIVVGDLGSFTMDQHRTVDGCLCYGASVATAIGCSMASAKNRVLCVTGDAAFLHSGKAAIEEAARRGADFLLIVIDNGGAVSTGGQRVLASVQFPGAASVTEAEHLSTSEKSYQMLINRLIDRPGVNVLHVRA